MCSCRCGYEGRPQGAGRGQGDRGRARRRRAISSASLKLTDFRNYARAELKLDARPVVLIGDNGSGKTNLLEAVSLLGPGHGLRGRPYGELCRKDGAGGFAVAATVVSREDEVEIGTGIACRHAARRARGRTVRIAGKEESAGALAEHVKLVWLIPAMDGLFTGPASERRRFLDRLVLAVDPEDAHARSAATTAPCGSGTGCSSCARAPRALFEGLEEQMAEAGTAIAAARLEAVARLVGADRARCARRAAKAPSRGPRSRSKGRLEEALSRLPATEVEDEFRALLGEGRERDRAGCARP